jgi:hypothetical protein
VSIKSWDSLQIKAFYNCCELDKVYISKLLLVIFKLNIKILSVINDSPISSTNLPSLKQFIYKTLIDTAKKLYQYPYIFDTNRKGGISNHDIANNIGKRYKLIHKSIINTIENYLPIHDIIVSPQEVINVTTTASDDPPENYDSSEHDSKSNSIVLLKSDSDSN